MLAPLPAYHGAAIVTTRTGTHAHLVLGGPDLDGTAVTMFTACGRRPDTSTITRTIPDGYTPCPRCVRQYTGRAVSFLNGLAQLAGLNDLDINLEAFRGYRLIADYEATPAVMTQRLRQVANILALIAGEGWPTEPAAVPSDR